MVSEAITTPVLIPGHQNGNLENSQNRGDYPFLFTPVLLISGRTVFFLPGLLFFVFT